MKIKIIVFSGRLREDERLLSGKYCIVPLTQCKGLND
jgi:hypothetical protein